MASARDPSRLARWFSRIGPGFITGAADDDPSGIATYSQAGAQFGFGMLWTVVVTYPLMAAVQASCGRIGRVTGKGLTANMMQIMPRPVVTGLVALLLVANTINIGADLAAMGAAAKLVFGWSEIAYTASFALISLSLQAYVPYHRYVTVLKWLTLSLLGYVGVVFIVHVDWSQVLLRTIVPDVDFSKAGLTVIVAVFGTTISPYLFFWQSSQEVEDEELDPNAGPLVDNPDQATGQLRRIAWDTYLGMAFSNLIAFFVIVTTAATLHVAGQTEIKTSAQAAEALRPLAGDFAFMLFALGIVATGLLALPVLAGSAAYAVAEARRWRSGLEHTPKDAPGFYTIIALSMTAGLAVVLLPIDPFKALFWSAVINGIIAVPIMVATMLVASSRRQLGRFVAPSWQTGIGWFATALMTAAAIAMFAT